MNKSQAIHRFWNSFGLLAFNEYTVPTGEDEPAFPYITYSVSESELDYPVTMYGSLWYRSTTWEGIEKKSYEIAEYIKRMNPIKIDDGYIAITSGVPFAQRMDEPSDDTVRRMIININAEYFTEY